MTSATCRASALLVPAFFLACGSPTETVQAPVVHPQSAPAVAAPPMMSAPSNREERAVLAVSEDIRRACGIETDETYFSYNSAHVQDSSRALLESVVTCFTTGPLSGSRLSLVGHADPRGDEEYNYALGGQRASRVQTRLEGLGFPTSRLSSTSRGESDARGADETGWRYDRKVELVLGS